MTYTGNYTRIYLWIIVVALTFISGVAFGQERGQAKDSVNKPVFVVTPRINSAGHFPFSGALINKHLNADVNVFFEYRRYGFFLFKSHDIKDPHSIVNYFQPGVFKKFQLGPQFKLGAFFGYLFSQTSGFRDRDSDYYSAVVAYWTINDRLKVENTSLFFDLSQSEKLANRLLITYLLKGFRIDLYLWHRWVFESNFHSLSASLALNLPKIRISDALYIQNTISYQGYVSEAKPDWARRKGLLISIAFPINLN